MAFMLCACGHDDGTPEEQKPPIGGLRYAELIEGSGQYEVGGGEKIVVKSAMPSRIWMAKAYLEDSQEVYSEEFGVNARWRGSKDYDATKFEGQAFSYQ